MDKENVYHFYCDILDKMLEKPVYKYYLQNPYSLCESYDIEDGILVTGISRAALVCDNCDYIVKFELSANRKSEGLCQREAFNYANAGKMRQYLCECEYLGTYCKKIEFWDFDNITANLQLYECDYLPDNIQDDINFKKKIIIRIPLYGYKKADFYHCKGYADLSKDEIAFCRNAHSPLTDASYGVGIEFREMYGLEEFKKFSRFCQEFKINDLHGGNVGLIAGKLVFIDYAGYGNGYGYESEDEY